MRGLRLTTPGKLVVLLGLASAASAQVNLVAPASPASASVGATVTVHGTGFPAGAISNTSVTVTITPPPGNGSPVTTPSTGATLVGSTEYISFKIPSGLVVNSPIVCLISVSGTTASGNSYTTNTPSSITVNPVPVITNISPGAGSLGTTVSSVAIAGAYTTFQNNSTISVSGTGVTAVNNGAVSTQLINATFTVAPNATPGARNVTVTTGTQTATIVGGFIVAAGPALSFASITPAAGQLAQTLTVHVVGTNTNFAQGTTFANFGDGIAVNSLSNFAGPTEARSTPASLSIQPPILGGAWSRPPPEASSPFQEPRDLM